MEHTFLFGRTDEDGDFISNLRLTFHRGWYEPDPDYTIKGDSVFKTTFDIWIRRCVDRFGIFMGPERLSPADIWSAVVCPSHNCPLGEMKVLGEIPERYKRDPDDDYEDEDDSEDGYH